jgi:hypothetical protein
MDALFGYPVPGAASQSRALPWLGGIDTISIRFSENVVGQINQSDLAILGSIRSYAFSGFRYDPAATRRRL